MQAIVKQMISGLIEVDASQAAASYIEDLPTLAKTQNTGMKPGEIRRAVKTADNPLGAGGALKSNEVFELKEADAATGKLRFTLTNSYDEASIKELTQSLTKKLLAAAGDSIKTAEVDSLMKSMVFKQDESAVFEVEDGMTRKITEVSTTVVRAMGHALSKTETRTVTVTRAP